MACTDLATYSCQNNRETRDSTNSFESRNRSEVKQEFVRQFDANISRSSLLQKARAILLNPADGSVGFDVFVSAGLPQNLSNCFDEFGTLINRTDRCVRPLQEALADIVRMRTLSLPVPETYPLASRSQLRNLVEYREAVSLEVTRLSTLVQAASVTDERKATLRRQFDAVISEFSNIIARVDVSDDVRQRMRNQLSRITLNLDDCNDSRDFTQPNAYYNTETRQMRICPSFALSTDSAFSVLFTIGHEIGHAFDRCALSDIQPSVMASQYSPQLQTALDVGHPFSNAVSCLRQDSSTSAKICSLERVRLGKAEYEADDRNQTRLYNETAADTHQICPGPNGLTVDDQTTELISDLFGTEALVESINQLHPNLTPEQWRIGIGNSFEFGCNLEPNTNQNNDNSANQCEVHPDTRTRLNRLISANPRIRSRMNCTTPSAANYCNLTNGSQDGFNRNSTSPPGSTPGSTPAEPRSPAPAAPASPSNNNQRVLGVQ